MTLRPARADEAEALAQLHVAAWRDAHAALAPAEATKALGVASRLPVWQRYLADATQHVLVVEQNSTLAGLVCFGPTSQLELGEQAEIKHLYVAASARQLGLGKTLLQAALAQLFESEYSKATLAVVSENEAARGFYRANGGQEVGAFVDAGPLWKSSNIIVEWKTE
ncbi:MAG: GNAT family N-acetyltransferase [Rhodobacteraceae bacterium]|nr:GNAT family N-acetyltransferase [Paracoccaceae bacterium]